jgi:hypothetical protein
LTPQTETPVPSLSPTPSPQGSSSGPPPTFQPSAGSSSSARIAPEADPQMNAPANSPQPNDANHRSTLGRPRLFDPRDRTAWQPAPGTLSSGSPWQPQSVVETALYRRTPLSAEQPAAEGNSAELDAQGWRASRG